LADVEEVDRIVVPFEPGERMFEVWALPRLRDRAVQEGVGDVRPDVLYESGGAFSGVVEDGVYSAVVVQSKLTKQKECKGAH
jgi:hypothetical protein